MAKKPTSVKKAVAPPSSSRNTRTPVVMQPVSRTTIAVPVDWVTSLFNASDERRRLEMLDYLRPPNDPNHKNHVLRGFFRNDDGTLGFSDALYEQGVYHGKVQTYVVAAMDDIKKFAGHGELVREFLKDAQERASAVADSLRDSALDAPTPAPESTSALLSLYQALQGLPSLLPDPRAPLFALFPPAATPVLPPPRRRRTRGNKAAKKAGVSRLRATK